MKAIIYPFMVLSAVGLALSIAAHCMALAGITIPGGKLVWGLHIGIFIVWLPTMFLAMRMTRHVQRKDFWKAALAGCPAWIRRSLYLIIGYAAFNFIFFVATTGKNIQRQKGDAPSAVIRGFSGHWMVFYSVAFAILYSAKSAPYLFYEHKCSQGHRVSPVANYCPECGEPISRN